MKQARALTSAQREMESLKRALERDRRYLCVECGFEFPKSQMSRKNKEIGDYCTSCWRTVKTTETAILALRKRRQTIYGLDHRTFSEMMSEQGGRCPICNRKIAERDCAVDHDHGSGKVRGLLCHRCNTGLGQLGDTLEALKRAYEYLKRAES